MSSIPHAPSVTRRRFLKAGFWGGMIATGGLGYANSALLATTRIDVPIPALPPAFDGFRIALAADFHTTDYADHRLYRAVGEAIREESPDLIALGGDFVTGPFTPNLLDELLDSLGPLSAPSGVMAVLGNHDFWNGPSSISTIASSFGQRFDGHVLRNRHRLIERNGEKIAVAGVDDFWEASCDLPKALAGIDRSTPTILLSHNPDINGETGLIDQVSLVLSGHTHGGQIALPFFGAPFLPSRFGQKYRAGLVTEGKRQTYVTTGVGTLLAPVRFNAPPEVAFLTLRQG